MEIENISASFLNREKPKIPKCGESSPKNQIIQKQKVHKRKLSVDGAESDDELYGFSEKFDLCGNAIDVSKKLKVSEDNHAVVTLNNNSLSAVSSKRKQNLVPKMESEGVSVMTPLTPPSVPVQTPTTPIVIDHVIKNNKIQSRASPKEPHLMKSNVVMGKRISKPKVPKGASPPPEGWTPTSALQNSGRLPIGSARSPPKKSYIEYGKGFKKIDHCTVRCVNGNGAVPEVSCHKCQQCYHSQCIGVDSGINKNDFVCPNCTANKNELHKNAAVSAASTPTSSKSSTASNSTSKSSTSSGVSNKESKEKSNDSNKKKKEPLQQPPPPPPGEDLEKIVEISNQLDKDGPQTLAVIKGKKYVVIKRDSVGRPLKKSSQPIDKTSDSPKSGRKSKELSKSPQKDQSDKNKALEPMSAKDNFYNNFFRNVSMGYEVLFHTFQYLTIKELLCCARVCRLWNLISNHKQLWRTVRMKNSNVDNWEGFARALNSNQTKHLDLRKMIISSQKDDWEKMWNEFSKSIGNVGTLENIEMCRCPSSAVENLFDTNVSLKILNAPLINELELSLTNLKNMTNLVELRLKGTDSLTLRDNENLGELKSLQNLVQLSLVSFTNITSEDLAFLTCLPKLESFEFGECTMLASDIATQILPKMKSLKRLRLENGKDDCPTDEILEAISKMENLTQLELVDFDLKPYLDKKLALCTNIKKLLLIPTYQQQSATTNHIILNGILKLFSSLEVFTWVVTIELIRVTALYVVQYEEPTKNSNRDSKAGNSKQSKKPSATGNKDNFDECIPVLKPVPGVIAESEYFDPIPLLQPNDPNVMPQIEILPLERVKTILRNGLPNTNFNIVKVPHSSIWKQGLVE